MGALAFYGLGFWGFGFSVYVFWGFTGLRVFGSGFWEQYACDGESHGKEHGESDVSWGYIWDRRGSRK